MPSGQLQSKQPHRSCRLHQQSANVPHAPVPARLAIRKLHECSPAQAARDQRRQAKLGGPTHRPCTLAAPQHSSHHVTTGHVQHTHTYQCNGSTTAGHVPGCLLPATLPVPLSHPCLLTLQTAKEDVKRPEVLCSAADAHGQSGAPHPPPWAQPGM